MSISWPVQDAKQRFSELLRSAAEEGPQFVTRHGREVAVVLDLADYRHLTGADVDFKEALAGPTPLDDALAEALDGIVAERQAESPRAVDLAETS